jgi:hypothetical protein
VRKLTTGWESGIRKNVSMAPLRRLGPFGIALTASTWDEASPAQAAPDQAPRKHGSRVVRGRHDRGGPACQERASLAIRSCSRAWAVG